MRTKRVVLLLIAIFLPLSGVVFGKIRPPKFPSPIIQNGTEYVADKGIGIVTARKEKTKKELWAKQIYSIKFNTDLEEDVQWVFITKMEIKGPELFVQNECGGEFALDLKTKEVRRIKGANVIDFSTPSMRALTCPERKPLK